MTLNDPVWLQNGTYSASEFRDVLEAFPGTGVLNDGDLKVTQRGAGANMSVDVAAGSCVIENSTASRGKYLCKSTAVENLVISASPGSGNSRIDIITAKVLDTEYGDASDEWQLVVIDGTASGSPTAPSLPAGSILLATIAVGTAVASITNANITDGRAYARAITYTDRLPSTAVNGQMLVSAAGAVSTRSAGTWKTAPNGSQFGSAVATMSATTLSTTPTGYCTATISAPTGAVNVLAQFNGNAGCVSGTDAVTVAKVQISTNGGSTWVDGASVTIVSPNTLSPTGVPAGHALTATPSGSVKARVLASKGTGTPNLSGHLTLLITPG